MGTSARHPTALTGEFSAQKLAAPTLVALSSLKFLFTIYFKSFFKESLIPFLFEITSSSRFINVNDDVSTDAERCRTELLTVSSSPFMYTYRSNFLDGQCSQDLE
jgi:hypothetical protein